MIQPSEIKVIQKYIKPGNLVFDIGANVGNWTRLVLDLVPNTIIHAFEPIPNIFPLIDHPRVIFNNTLLYCAILNDLDFYHYKCCPSLSTMYRRSEEVERINIGEAPERLNMRANTISYYCQKNNIKHINFMKIDVEGAEYDVLTGSLLMLPHTDFIQFEYGGCNKDSHTSLYGIYNFMVKHGYKVYKIQEDPNELLLYIATFNDSLEDYQLNNFLAVRN